MSALETSRELIRHSYYRYEFATVAVTHSLFALEHVLAERLATNGPLKWPHFGGDGYLRSRDPELQEKAVKFLDLMANSIILSTTVDMTDALRRIATQGWELNPDDLAALSPHRRHNVLRFGDYDTARHRHPARPTRPI